MKKLSLLTILFAICCGINFGQISPAPKIMNNLPSDLVGLKGQTAPQFILPAMNETEYNLENLRGKIVVINLWGTFCSPCLAEMPELNTLVKEFKDKEVVFLALATDDKADLETFLKNRSFDYQVLPNAYAVIKKYAPHKKSADPQQNDDFMMIFPTHLVIDQTGIVTYHNWGYSKNTVAELTKEIKNLLAKKD